MRLSINRDKVLTLIGEANKALGQLKSYAVTNENKLISSIEKMASIKYHFIILIEACIDICNHIISKRFSIIPESYSHCFRLLGEKGIINGVLSEKMAELARFRNVLVHLYWSVDDNRVLEILKKDLVYFEEYLESIAKFLQNSLSG